MSHFVGQQSKAVWRTPQIVLQPTRRVFGGRIGLDPATDEDNPTDAARYYTEVEDGLSMPWDSDTIFLNPPWSKKAPTMPIRWWVALAWDVAQSRPQSQIIVVTPASVSSAWFHDYLWPAPLRCFPKGRICYEMPPGWANDDAPNFDSCITYFGPMSGRFRRNFERLGAVV